MLNLFLEILYFVDFNNLRIKNFLKNECVILDWLFFFFGILVICNLCWDEDNGFIYLFGFYLYVVFYLFNLFICYYFIYDLFGN